MSDPNSAIEEAAVAWLLRVNDADFVAWEDWRAWMTADPRHADAYWRLAEGEADIVDVLSQQPQRGGALAVPEPLRRHGRTALRRPPGRTRRLAIGLPIAAALVGALWLGTAWWAPHAITTEPGQRRSLTLADGTTVHLDGGTRVILSRGRPRAVSLEAGRGLFEVAHDAGRPFVVTVGDARVTDLGTVFDVTRLSRGVRVGVSEGMVRIDQGGRSERLGPGEGVVATAQGMSRRRLQVEQVSSWRNARLAYDAEPLAIVAEDLSRALGISISVDPSLAQRPFSGSIATSFPRTELRGRLERLLDVSIVEHDAGWRLQPHTSA